MKRMWISLLLAGALLAQPAGATVAEGVAEWRAGNYKEAVMLWLPAAARGNAHALFNLGLAHRQGRGVPRDLDRAEDFFRRAAEKGHAPARTYLGIFMARRGQVADAVELWKASAAEGDAYARYMLGIRHYGGKGVEEDRPRAYAYLLLAERGGVKQARKVLRRMEEGLTTQEKAAGRTLAEEIAGVPVVTLSDAGRGAAPAARAAAQAEAEANRNQGTAIQEVAVPAPREPQESRSDEDTVLTADATQFRVQLGAFQTRGQAESGWTNIQRKLPGLLDGTTPVYREFAGGVRLRIGEYADRAGASARCAEIKAAGQACFVAAED
ncbi:hypothetical protein B5C34_13155 [Pacificimonas flava]|uniref:SPOR domain-containing protein n=2 Tax=Pacificimonas TaxID=1960290 RepID=A0A219B7E1_9SPHN|nr:MULTISPECIES: SPOR domain-containing protein [Pacificimonas]MBZ6378383.1 SEL1-like repeat protein [Pacificimonas aurantium]OWV34312.1 hypothetical protein B5C34_13155 [Pacificimonas flava]